MPIDLAHKFKSPLMPPMDGSIAAFKFDQTCNLETNHYNLCMAWLVLELVYAESLRVTPHVRAASLGYIHADGNLASIDRRRRDSSRDARR